MSLLTLSGQLGRYTRTVLTGPSVTHIAPNLEEVKLCCYTTTSLKYILTLEDAMNREELIAFQELALVLNKEVF